MGMTIMGGTAMVIIDRGVPPALSLIRVMAGFSPATHDFSSTTPRQTWVAGLNPAMTQGGKSRS